LALASGSDLLIIDRAVNSKAMAQAFDEAGLGLRCMLNDNEHDGLERVEATVVKTLDDGTRLDEGPWKVTREDDARHVVIVAPEAGKRLVYWGSAKVKAELETSAWSEVYRARPELQENAFKRMLEHGALDIKVGRKTIMGPDRHQQRAEAKGRDSLESANLKVVKKSLELEANRELVAESESKGPWSSTTSRASATGSATTSVVSFSDWLIEPTLMGTPNRSAIASVAVRLDRR